MTDFMPELGQFGFSNTPWQEIDSPAWINPGLEAIATAIKAQRGEGDDDWTELTSNSGSDSFENDIFAMRSYCWCDGERPGHEDGCPPNFEHKPSELIINWYKHSCRGRSQNKVVSGAEWTAIVSECLRSVSVGDES